MEIAYLKQKTKYIFAGSRKAHIHTLHTHGVHDHAALTCQRYAPQRYARLSMDSTFFSESIATESIGSKPVFDINSGLPTVAIDTVVSSDVLTFN
jgi:hypothetical protein